MKACPARTVVRDHLEPHPGMAEAAIFSADGLIGARLRRLDPEYIDFAGNGIELASKTRHPEAVDDVPAGDAHINRHACRNIEHADPLNHASVGSRLAKGPLPLFRVSFGSDHAGIVFWDQPLAKDQAVGQQRDQHGAGEDEAAKNPHALCLRARRIALDEGEREEHHDERCNTRCAGKHDPPQHIDLRGRLPGRIECGQITGTACQQNGGGEG